MGTIGYSGTPATGAQQPIYDGVPIATPATADVAGTISQTEAYINGPVELGSPGSTQQTRMGIYADASNAPGALLVISNEVVLDQGSGPAWRPYLFSTPLSVTAGQLLWLILHGGAQDQQVAIGYDGAGPSVYTLAAYASGLPDPFGSPTAVGMLYALRATVIPTGGSVSATVDVHGHSYASGLGVAAAERATSVFTAAIGGTETNNGVAGSQVAIDLKSNGGWARGYADLPRAGGSIDSAPGPDIAIPWWGINDIAAYYGYTGGRTLVKHGMRAMIARYRCARVYETDDATVTLGAGWTLNNAGDDFMSGGECQARTTIGTDVVVINVPPSYTGRPIALGYLNVGTDGAVWSVSVDGGVPQTLDTRALTTAADHVHTFVQRLTGLTPGAHTIRVSLTAITGTAYFDWWGAESPTPPLVLIPSQPRLTTAGYGQYGSYPHVPTDGDVANFNADLAALASEFDSDVRVADTSALDSNASYFQADGLHPNVTGHSMIATALQSESTLGPSMPRVDIPITQITDSGVVQPAAVTGDPANDHVLAFNDGRVFLMISTTANDTVTIVTPGDIAGLAVSDRNIAMVGTQTKFVGPLSPNLYNQADGTVQVDVGAATTTLRAFRV